MEVLNPEGNPEEKRKGGRLGKALLAALLSLFFPGAGQAYNGEIRKAFSFYGLWAILLFVLILSPLMHYFAGLIIVVTAELYFFMHVVLDAFIVGKRRGFDLAGSVPRKRRVSAAIVIVAVHILFIVSYESHMTESLRFRAYVIPSVSMEPTLRPGDRIVTDPRFWRNHEPQRGDLAIMAMPDPNQSDDEIMYVKRVVAVGGDQVCIRDGGLWINGKRVEETYLRNPEGNRQAEAGMEFGPIQVPQEEVFVLGDNRNNSYDSRYHGPIKRDALRGKPLYIYWSKDWRRIGRELK